MARVRQHAAAASRLDSDVFGCTYGVQCSALLKECARAAVHVCMALMKMPKVSCIRLAEVCSINPVCNPNSKT